MYTVFVENDCQLSGGENFPPFVTNLYLVKIYGNFIC